MFTIKVSSTAKKSPQGPNIPNCGRILFSLFKKMEAAGWISAVLQGRLDQQ
jgi:hypothetical protein